MRMIRLCTLAAATVLVGGAYVAPAFAKKELSLSYFMGPKHRFNAAYFTPFATQLAKLSGGKLTVKQYPGGVLNSAPPRQYSILVSGVADIAFGIASYTHELFPISSSISVPGACNGSVGCTEALWRAYPLLKKEYGKAKILAMWSNASMAIVSKTKPIQTLADFKGLKIRVSSKVEARFMAALGATPVSQSVTVINQNLANGTIDAIAIDPTSVIGFKLYEPAKYVTLGMPTSGLPFWLLMNKSVYDKMSAQEKGWIDAASGKELSIKGAKATAAMTDKALKAIRNAGVQVLRFSDAEVGKIKAAFAPELAKFKGEQLRGGVTGAQVFDAMKGGK